MDTAYDFGMILQKLRMEKGITQKQLADMINKESSIISKYEKTFKVRHSIPSGHSPLFSMFQWIICPVWKKV